MEERKYWTISSSERTYFLEDATEAEAEELRRHKAKGHAAVFRKRPSTPDEIEEAKRQDLLGF